MATLHQDLQCQDWEYWESIQFWVIQQFITPLWFAHLCVLCELQHVTWWPKQWVEELSSLLSSNTCSDTGQGWRVPGSNGCLHAQIILHRTFTQTHFIFDYTLLPMVITIELSCLLAPWKKPSPPNCLINVMSGHGKHIEASSTLLWCHQSPVSTLPHSLTIPCDNCYIRTQFL